jgi:hypothetical protein
MISQFELLLNTFSSHMNKVKETSAVLFRANTLMAKLFVEQALEGGSN